MNNAIIAAVITLVVAGGGGYVAGKSSVETGVSMQAHQDSVVMMQKQSASIKEMGEMMKSGGMMMQELGAKYKDDMMMSKGKDLEMVGAKHMGEDMTAGHGTDSMHQMMGNE
ncbi:MAG TPA: hypothetical protein VI953_03940 [Candidatus Paceibacterota bacterium]